MFPVTLCSQTDRKTVTVMKLIMRHAEICKEKKNLNP